MVSRPARVAAWTSRPGTKGFACLLQQQADSAQDGVSLCYESVIHRRCQALTRHDWQTASLATACASVDLMQSLWKHTQPFVR